MLEINGLLRHVERCTFHRESDLLTAHSLSFAAGCPSVALFTVSLEYAPVTVIEMI